MFRFIQRLDSRENCENSAALTEAERFLGYGFEVPLLLSKLVGQKEILKVFIYNF